MGAIPPIELKKLIAPTVPMVPNPRMVLTQPIKQTQTTKLIKPIKVTQATKLTPQTQAMVLFNGMAHKLLRHLNYQ